MQHALRSVLTVWLPPPDWENSPRRSAREERTPPLSLYVQAATRLIFRGGHAPRGGTVWCWCRNVPQHFHARTQFHSRACWGETVNV